MKFLLIVLAVVVALILLGVVLEVWSDRRHRRWRKWFDSLPSAEKRRYQEDMYKLQQGG